MTNLGRQIRAFVLPVLVVLIVPYGVLGAAAIPPHPSPFVTWLFRLIGLTVAGLGLTLFSWCIALFARIGQGTLAPWDPTRHLVAIGPYRLIRNPMITSVAVMLLGEALFWRSGAVALWAALFVLINHLYFILAEEPGLERRFGDDYRTYKQQVPRWVPRLNRRTIW